MSSEAKHPVTATTASAGDNYLGTAPLPKSGLLSWSNMVVGLSLPAAAIALAPLARSWHWTLDLASCFPVQAITALAIAATALAIGRKWKPAAALLALAIASTATNMGIYLGQNSSPDSVDNTPHLDVLALNLLSSNKQGQQAILAVVQAESPDVIWCAEYTPHWQAFLRSELKDYPYRCEQAATDSFGTALFSKHPLKQAEMIPLGHSWAPACRTVIHTRSGDIGFLGVHPPPPGLSARRVAERDRGLAAIPQTLANLPPRRIVCGDFNTTPWNAAYERLLEAADLSPGSASTWLPTWPARLPALLRIPIDHVLTGGTLQVATARLGPNFGSDHLPLLAQIHLQ